MALTLSKTNMVTGNTIQASDVSQSIDALTGTTSYDITISGSLKLTGSVSSKNGFTGSLTGSLNGTSSWALSASNAYDYATDASNSADAAFQYKVDASNSADDK